MVPIPSPMLDPTSIFEHYRGAYGTELLVAAACHFRLFDHLADEPLSHSELASQLDLADRPLIVLTTALRAMGLLTTDAADRFALTPLARANLVSTAEFNINGYLGLSADSPGVVTMVERLRTNRPAGSAPRDDGTAFIYRAGEKSAMEHEAAARRFTLALAGRAKIVAPRLAENYPLDDAWTLLDVGGGTGIYSIAWLRRHPRLRAVVWDRPEVLRVAGELAIEYGVADRLKCVAGDMFHDSPPAAADVILLSNILHDWDAPDCERLVRRCAEALTPRGRLLIHDVFLNDALDGPLPIALYSAALFTVTEGRAYSAAEYRQWLATAGLVPGEITPTLVHCGVLPGTKP